MLGIQKIKETKIFQTPAVQKMIGLFNKEMIRDKLWRADNDKPFFSHMVKQGALVLFTGVAITAAAIYIGNRESNDETHQAYQGMMPLTEQLTPAPEKEGGFDISSHVDKKTFKLYETYGIVQQTNYDNVFTKQDGYVKELSSTEDVARFLLKNGMWRSEWTPATINRELIDKMNFFPPGIPENVLADALAKVRAQEPSSEEKK